MSYDGWLEAPYIAEADAQELLEEAEEHGFDSVEDYLESLECDRADWERKYSKENPEEG